jgi:hypothetical protein
MTRVVAAVSLLAAIAVTPARADTGGIVIVNRSEYMPGDDQNKVPALLVHGHDLQFENLDIASFGSTHSMTSDVEGLFDSGVIQARQSATLPVASLPAGTYGFHCSVHSDTMHGTLIIV